MPVYIASDNIITSLGFSTEENVVNIIDEVVGVKIVNDIKFSPNTFYASQIDNEKLNFKSKNIINSERYTRFEKLAIISISDALGKINFDLFLEQIMNK